MTIIVLWRFVSYRDRIDIDIFFITVEYLHVYTHLRYVYIFSFSPLLFDNTVYVAGANSF